MKPLTRTINTSRPDMLDGMDEDRVLRKAVARARAERLAKAKANAPKKAA